MKNAVYVQALQIIASGVHALGAQQAHDADGQMDRTDRTDSFGGEFGFAGFIRCGDMGREALK